MNGETVFEVAMHRKFDRASGRVGHKTLHTGELRDLTPVSTSAGIDHVRDVVLRVAVELRDHRRGDLVLGLAPDTDSVAVPLICSDETLPVEVVDRADFLIRILDELLALIGHEDVRNGDGNTGECDVIETDRFDERRNRL